MPIVFLLVDSLLLVIHCTCAFLLKPLDSICKSSVLLKVSILSQIILLPFCPMLGSGWSVISIRFNLCILMHSLGPILQASLCLDLPKFLDCFSWWV